MISMPAKKFNKAKFRESYNQSIICSLSGAALALDDMFIFFQIK